MSADSRFSVFSSTLTWKIQTSYRSTSPWSSNWNNWWQDQGCSPKIKKCVEDVHARHLWIGQSRLGQWPADNHPLDNNARTIIPVRTFTNSRYSGDMKEWLPNQRLLSLIQLLFKLCFYHQFSFYFKKTFISSIKLLLKQWIEAG